MNRDNKGEVIWPKPSKGLMKKVFLSCREKYQAMGMWRMKHHEQEFWDANEVPPSDRHQQLPEGGFCCVPAEDHTIERAGWCLSCKYPKSSCQCDVEQDSLFDGWER